MRRLLSFALFVLLTAACLGPKPQVRSAEVAPPEDGKAKVTVTITNEGSGDGQVQVRVTLREGDQVVAREERTSELKAYETIEARVGGQRPRRRAGAEVEAEVHYPPD